MLPRRSQVEAPEPERAQELSRLLARVEHGVAPGAGSVPAAAPVSRARNDVGVGSPIHSAAPELAQEAPVPLTGLDGVEAVHEALAKEPRQALLVAVPGDRFGSERQRVAGLDDAIREIDVLTPPEAFVEPAHLQQDLASRRPIHRDRVGRTKHLDALAVIVDRLAEPLDVVRRLPREYGPAGDPNIGIPKGNDEVSQPVRIDHAVGV